MSKSALIQDNLSKVNEITEDPQPKPNTEENQ